MIKLDHYQIEAFNLAVKFNGFGLFSVQGTGKTLITIKLIEHRINYSKINKVLIIGPLGAIDVWEQELKKFAEFKYELTKFQSRYGRKNKLPEPRKDDPCA